jgi:CHASE2 domain-containing sensor protein
VQSGTYIGLQCLVYAAKSLGYDASACMCYVSGMLALLCWQKNQLAVVVLAWIIGSYCILMLTSNSSCQQPNLPAHPPAYCAVFKYARQALWHCELLQHCL